MCSCSVYGRLAWSGSAAAMGGNVSLGGTLGVSPRWDYGGGDRSAKIVLLSGCGEACCAKPVDISAMSGGALGCLPAILCWRPFSPVLGSEVRGCSSAGLVGKPHRVPAAVFPSAR